MGEDTGKNRKMEAGEEVALYRIVYRIEEYYSTFGGRR